MANIERDKAWMARRAATSWVRLQQLCIHGEEPAKCEYCNDPNLEYTPDVVGTMPWPVAYLDHAKLRAP